MSVLPKLGSKMKKLSAPSLDDTNIYNFYIGSRASAVLAASLKIGLFEILEKKPKSLEELCRELNLSRRGARSFLRSLVAMNLLNEQDKNFSNTEQTSAFLLKNKQGYIGALIEMEVENFLSPEKILLAAKEDRPTAYGKEDVWTNHQHDAAQASRFTAAMHSISTKPAIALSQCSFWEKSRHLCDIGAGSGVYSIALMQRFPSLRTTLCDISNMKKITMKYIAEYGLEERSQFIGFDMFSDPWPECDTVLLSQILHDWNYEQGCSLLEKAHQALGRDGRIVIHEKLTDCQNHKPLANALVNLDMLMWTDGQQYSFQELKILLHKTGFTDVVCIKTEGYWSAITATTT